MIHSNSVKNHKIENWTYANAAARTGATGFTSADIGKLAYQTDNQTYWRLTATTPTWIQAMAGPAGAAGAAGAVWRSGAGAPDNGVGANGDFYLRTSNGDVYERQAGAYVVVANIEGAAGPAGADGEPGGFALRFNKIADSAAVNPGDENFTINTGAGDHVFVSAVSLNDTGNYSDFLNVQQGWLMIRGITDPTFWQFRKITARTLNATGSGWEDYTTTFIAGSGAFVTGDVYAIAFAHPQSPAGGTTGQVLAKASNTDHHTTWVTPTGNEDWKLSSRTVLGALGNFNITAIPQTHRNMRITLIGQSNSGNAEDSIMFSPFGFSGGQWVMEEQIGSVVTPGSGSSPVPGAGVGMEVGKSNGVTAGRICSIVIDIPNYSNNGSGSGFPKLITATNIQMNTDFSVSRRTYWAYLDDQAPVSEFQMYVDGGEQFKVGAILMIELSGKI